MSRIMLRHLVATLAYRAAKVLRDAPADFGTFQVAVAARRPVQIVAHMADLMSWGVTLANGEYVWKAEGGDGLEYGGRALLRQAGRARRGARSCRPARGRREKLIQGPLADALTHVGQLALLRGAAGAPIRPESYARADIAAGRVGMTQSAPVTEFDGDASAPR